MPSPTHSTFGSLKSTCRRAPDHAQGVRDRRPETCAVDHVRNMLGPVTYLAYVPARASKWGMA